MNPPRNDPFVPLLNVEPSTDERAEFRVTVISQGTGTQPFHSLTAVPPAPGKTGALCEPRLTLQRDGDKISSIRIECGCGQVIELACVYGK